MSVEQVLPPEAEEILRSNNVSPRLTAHHQLVYGIAKEILQGIQNLVPGVVLDVQAVELGSALHDIGKTVVPAEITHLGNRHEELGETLLLGQGIEPRIARFARTHGLSNSELELEDLLVILADKIWKWKREEWLESTLLDKLLEQARQDRWELFIALDSLIESIALEADARLAWYAQHSV